MRIPKSRTRAAILLAFLVVVGLSMVAGPCYPDDAGTQGPPPLPTEVPTSRPGSPPTASPFLTPTPVGGTPTKETPVVESTPAKSTPVSHIPESTEDMNQARTAAPTSPVAGNTEADTTEAVNTEAVNEDEPENAVQTIAPPDTSPRDVRGGLFSPPPSAAASDFITNTITVEELLEDGWFASGVSPSHLVIRARIDSDSVRCSWENIGEL